jgi:aconitate hydratase
MGVLPLVFTGGESWLSLGLTGSEIVSLSGISSLVPRQELGAHITFADGSTKEVTLLTRIDTLDELDYFRHGGILPYVLRNLNRSAA